MISFSVSLPVMFYMEGAQWSAFVAHCWSSPTLVRNVFCSGISFYVYDELATITVNAVNIFFQKNKFTFFYWLAIYTIRPAMTCAVMSPHR